MTSIYIGVSGYASHLDRDGGGCALVLLAAALPVLVTAAGALAVVRFG